MKRFLIVLTALILGYLAYDTARYYLGWYIDLQPDVPVSAFMSTDAQHLYMDRGAGPEEFTVKGVNLGVLFDARIGGQGVSATQALMDRWGASQDSADARENGGVWISEDQKVPDARVFYANNGNGLSMLSHYVYSMTNVRLRELTLGYDLPSRWFNDKIGMTVSLVGRNLWMLYNKAPFDPEITASTGTYYQGLDYFMQPSARTIGFSVRLQF